jgi:hypothetical protein
MELEEVRNDPHLEHRRDWPGNFWTRSHAIVALGCPSPAFSAIRSNRLMADWINSPIRDSQPSALNDHALFSPDRKLIRQLSETKRRGCNNNFFSSTARS